MSHVDHCTCTYRKCWWMWRFPKHLLHMKNSPKYLVKGKWTKRKEKKTLTILFPMYYLINACRFLGRGLLTLLDYDAWKPRRSLYDPSFTKGYTCNVVLRVHVTCDCISFGMQDFPVWKNALGGRGREKIWDDGLMNYFPYTWRIYWL